MSTGLSAVRAVRATAALPTAPGPAVLVPPAVAVAQYPGHVHNVFGW